MDDRVRYEGNEGTSGTPCPSREGGVGKGESITVQSGCGRVDKKQIIYGLEGVTGKEFGWMLLAE